MRYAIALDTAARASAPADREGEAMITAGVRVLNVGLPLIVEGVKPERLVQLNWRPPAFGDAEATEDMVSLDTERTQTANELAVAAMHAVRPQLTGVQRPSRPSRRWPSAGSCCTPGPPSRWSACAVRCSGA